MRPWAERWSKNQLTPNYQSNFQAILKFQRTQNLDLNESAENGVLISVS